MMFHYTIYKVNVLWLQNSIIENFDIVKMHYTRSNIIISMFMSFCNTDEEGGGGAPVHVLNFYKGCHLITLSTVEKFLR